MSTKAEKRKSHDDAAEGLEQGLRIPPVATGAKAPQANTVSSLGGAGLVDRTPAGADDDAD